MTRLSEKQIEKIVSLYLKSHNVKEIAKKFGITKYAIYYHLRRTATHKIIEHPITYRDYIINSIIHIEEKIEKGLYEPQNIKFAESEIRRLKGALKIDRKEIIDNDVIITE